MLLSSSIGPERNLPEGTTTSPPPARRQAAIVSWNAPVFENLPSPTAPNSRIENWRGGTFGRCGTTDQLRCWPDTFLPVQGNNWLPAQTSNANASHSNCRLIGGN